MVGIDASHLAEKKRHIARGGDIAQHRQADTAGILPSVQGGPQMFLSASPRQLGSPGHESDRHNRPELFGHGINSRALCRSETSPSHLQVVRSTPLRVASGVDQEQQPLVLEGRDCALHASDQDLRAIGPERGEGRRGITFQARKRAVHVNCPPDIVVECRRMHEHAAMREVRQLAPMCSLERSAEGIHSIGMDQDVAVGGPSATSRELLVQSLSLDVQHRSGGILRDQLQRPMGEAKPSAHGHRRRELVHGATLGVGARRGGPRSELNRPLGLVDRR